MTMNKVFGAAFVVGLVGVVGCSAETGTGSDRSELVEASTCSAADAVDTSTRPRGINFNGMRMNGIALNGVNFNGAKLNGLSLNGVAFNGVRLNGIAFNGPLLQGPQLQGTKLNGPVLQGTTINGVQLQGTKFAGLPVGTSIAGAELVGELSDGSKLSVYIDAVHENADPRNADVALYEVTYGASREPFCGRDQAGAAILATAIANTWDEKTGARIDRADRFTFACTNGALYKCVAAGYKPWTGASMADYHQSCTRMIRADYCGDGTSYTKDGTLIDMGDALGAQSFETGARADFAVEASWGPNGATCVSKTRYRLPNVPQCLADRLAESCGDLAAAGERSSGVALMNRSAAETTCIQ